MKTIGLLGGMSWESTAVYYRLINQEVAARLGGFHSGRIAMRSVDFHELEALQARGAWEEAGALVAEEARCLERAGADFVVLTSNTMHIAADAIQAAVGIPLLHIVDATAAAIGRAGIGTIGLLGTRFTMEKPFYRERFERSGARLLVPADEDRALVHRVIYQELCHGRLVEESRAEFLRIMARLAAAGARGLILGCTEISLLVPPEACPLPAFDSTAIHACAAVDFALDATP